jgi:hypothetical protein
MKKLNFNCYIFFSLAFLQITFGQERVITGKILDSQNLVPFPSVLISSNSKVIATTDINGNFEFKLTPEIKKIEINFLGIQEEQVIITNDCNHIGVILIEQGIYDFVTLKAAERKQKRHRNKILPKLYVEAYEKNLFEKKSCC